jgi:hypothetical protein
MKLHAALVRCDCTPVDLRPLHLHALSVAIVHAGTKLSRTLLHIHARMRARTLALTRIFKRAHTQQLTIAHVRASACTHARIRARTRLRTGARVGAAMEQMGRRAGWGFMLRLDDDARYSLFCRAITVHCSGSLLTGPQC